MVEKIKICLHCGSPMQSSRSTKKYCSDACKQAAFYSRAAQPGTCGATVRDKPEALSDDQLPNAMVSESPFTEEASEYAIGLNDDIQFNVTENEDGKPIRLKQQYCIPIVSGRSLIAAPITEERGKKILPLSVEKRRESNQERPLNDKPNVKPAQKTAMKSYPIEYDGWYEWVRCELLDEVGDYFNDNCKTTEMFQYPKKYWYSSDLEKVNWVSIRFRNIVENMLHMDRRLVDRKLIKQLNEALKAMIASFNFRYMPHNYPLKTEVINLQKTLQQVVVQADRTIRFTLARTTKIKLMAIRFQLADLVPGSKFRKLDFSK